ncbi:MAG: redoxin domain-containing protein [Isosphaeraceae bacterium]
MYRRNIIKTAVAGISVSALAESMVFADPEGLKPLAIGSKAPDFDLPGVDDKRYRLADFNSAEVLVVIFTCNHCPTAQAYEERMMQFVEKYRSRGVAVVAISPNDDKALRLDELGFTDVSDSLADMKVRAADRKFNFPYLYDGESQKVALAYGCLATPHVFVFDKNRQLQYQGRFDDAEVGLVKSHDTINAVEALLAGKAVPVVTTRVRGCSTKWSDKRQQAAEHLAKCNAEPVSLEKADLKTIRELAENTKTNKYLLVNLWATWCGPCVAELASFVEMNRMYRKRDFELVTISVDQPEETAKALAALKEHHASCRNYIFTGENQDALADAIDKAWPGPVPHTVLIAPGGKIVYRKNGEIDAKALKKVLADTLGRTYGSKKA